MADKTKDELAEDYKARAEADFNPSETKRERLARLTAEVKAVEAEAIAEETAKAAAKVAPLIASLVKAIEDQNPGKVCRKLNVRYARPGDEVPEIVEKLEPKTPGIFVSFSVVKPRAAKKVDSKS